MDWQELEAFRTLAQEQHFGRAAERLYLSRARVSQLIKALERRVGAPLFERTSRRVALTPIGGALLADMTPHYDGLERALATASEAARGISGTLRVGFSSPRASEMIMAVAEHFRTQHPTCEVRIHEVHLSDRFGALRRGELDLELVELPVIEADLTVGPVLLRDEPVLVVACEHPLAARGFAVLEDLGDHEVPVVAGMPDYFLDQLVPAVTPSGRPVRRKPVTRYWQELLALVAAGAGVTVATAQGAGYYPRPNLVYLPLRDASPVEYALVWPSAGETERCRAFATIALSTSQASDRAHRA
ncbi:LysR family transcriptional regulator [Nocardia thailandica]